MKLLTVVTVMAPSYLILNQRKILAICICDKKIKIKFVQLMCKVEKDLNI
jgi:hypothetical protein